MHNGDRFERRGWRTAIAVVRWIYVVLTCVLLLAFGAMFAAAYYAFSSPVAGSVIGLVVLGGVAAFVLRNGFGIALASWRKTEPVRASDLPRRFVGLLVGYAFAGWCFYMGVYVPRQFEADLKRMERGLSERADRSIGEDNVGESLDD
mgnify:CR=1 FL=1